MTLHSVRSGECLHQSSFPHVSEVEPAGRLAYLEEPRSSKIALGSFFAGA